MTPMNEVTQILSGIEAGDPHAAEQLLPLVYDELRQLATHQLAQEKPGQTLQATALFHEAHLRLVGKEPDAHWNSRGTSSRRRPRPRAVTRATAPAVKLPKGQAARRVATPTKGNLLKSPDTRDEAAYPGGATHRGLRAAGRARSLPQGGESTFSWKYFLAPSTISLST
jgi:hypothetical protein